MSTVTSKQINITQHEKEATIIIIVQLRVPNLHHNIHSLNSSLVSHKCG